MTKMMDVQACVRLLACMDWVWLLSCRAATCSQDVFPATGRTDGKAHVSVHMIISKRCLDKVLALGEYSAAR